MNHIVKVWQDVVNGICFNLESRAEPPGWLERPPVGYTERELTLAIAYYVGLLLHKRFLWFPHVYKWWKGQ